MSFISDVKLAAQILGLVILIITLILTLHRLLTINSTAANAQILPGSNLAGSDGVTNSSSQENIQMKALNVNPVKTITYYVDFSQLGASNINKLKQSALFCFCWFV